MPVLASRLGAKEKACFLLKHLVNVFVQLHSECTMLISICHLTLWLAPYGQKVGLHVSVFVATAACTTAALRQQGFKV